jgi:hypothetical protein
MYDDAVEKLRTMNVQQATAHIAKLPMSLFELYLVAEQRHGNRKSILSQFPPVDPASVEHWEQIASSSVGIQEDGDDPTLTDAEE